MGVEDERPTVLLGKPLDVKGPVHLVLLIRLLTPSGPFALIGLRSLPSASGRIRAA